MNRNFDDERATALGKGWTKLCGFETDYSVRLTEQGKYFGTIEWKENEAAGPLGLIEGRKKNDATRCVGDSRRRPADVAELRSEGFEALNPTIEAIYVPFYEENVSKRS